MKKQIKILLKRFTVENDIKLLLYVFEFDSSCLHLKKKKNLFMLKWNILIIKENTLLLYGNTLVFKHSFVESYFVNKPKKKTN